jgi:histidinol-phosphate aminotransferase
MPMFRSDVRAISPYVPGRPIADVAAEHGFDPGDVVKLASNESPIPPIPEVQQAMAAALGEVHRYPDNQARLLTAALAESLGVEAGQVVVGGGSSEILRIVATAMGGPGTSVVFAWPSFVVYRLASVHAMSRVVEVPLDGEQRHDLGAMLAAVTDDTSVVYVCNPNNPTGTIRTAEEIAAFVDAVPEHAMVVIDEAYHEFVTDPRHASALPLAVQRPNVIVTRTFSKIHALASLRVGYGVTAAENVVELRKAQAPFSVTAPGQAGALEWLRHPGEILARRQANAEGRAELERGLSQLGIHHVPSHANFVSFRLRASTTETTEAFLRHGIILRPFGSGWVRVTVGSEVENRRFLEALRLEVDELA